MLTMREYEKENYNDCIEDWESMTPYDRLEEYIINIYNMEFLDDENVGKVHTVEELIENNKKALKEIELKDCWNDIKSNIRELEKYKDKGLFSKYAVDQDSCIWGQAEIIFDENYRYVSMIRVI